MALYDEGVTSESPAETLPAAPPTDADQSAGTLNTDAQAPRVEQSIPYARFKEVNDGYRSEAARAAAAEQRAALLERQSQDYQQRLQALEQRLQQRIDQPSRTPQEEQERRAALQALRNLQSDDPDYARMQKAAQALPAVAQALLKLQEQQAQAETRYAQSFARSEEGRLQSMATAAGLKFQNDEQFQALNNYVAGVIRSNPTALAAFQAGDVGVLPWAFDRARQEYAAQAQAARAAAAATKTSTGQLPPPLRGGVPGAAPTLPKFDPANPDVFEKELFAKARSSLIERMGR